MEIIVKLENVTIIRNEYWLNIKMESEWENQNREHIEADYVEFESLRDTLDDIETMWNRIIK